MNPRPRTGPASLKSVERAHQELLAARTGFPALVVPELQDDLCAYLGAGRRVAIAGPARSGKTTAALLAALASLDSGEFFSRAFYLDFSAVDSVSELADLPPQTVSANALFVIDNWHIRPDFQQTLAKFIEAHAHTRATVVIVITLADRDQVLLQLPGGELAEQTPWRIVYSDWMAEQIARTLIESTLREANPGALVSPDDVDRVLHMRPYFGGFVRNLRALCWHLAAWDPQRGRLYDVDEAAIAATVKDELALKAAPWTATLERIAVFAQWELPFKRGLAAEPLSGTDDLAARGLISGSDPEWYMDPTDARLLLRVLHPDEWVDYTIAALLKDLPRSADGLFALATAVLRDADVSARQQIFSKLNVDGALTSGLSQGLLSALRSGPEARAISSLDLLLRGAPLDERERASWVERLKGTLTDDVVDAMADAVANKNLQRMMWVAIYMRRARPELDSAIRRFFARIGSVRITAAVEANRSRSVRDKFLRILRSVDPDTAKSLADVGKLPGIHPRAGSRKLSPAQLRSAIAHATTTDGKTRRSMTAFIEELDWNDVLHALGDTRGPRLENFQKLISSAIWLSPAGARHLAAFAPDLFSTVRENGESLEGLKMLLYNLNGASPSIAANFVDMLARLPLAELVRRAAPRIGGIIYEMDRIQPGAAGPFVMSNAETFERWIATPHADAAADLKSLWLLLSEEACARFCDATSLASGTAPDDPFSWWEFEGIRLLCAASVPSRVDELPAPPGLAPMRAVDSILVAYAIEKHSGPDAAAAWISGAGDAMPGELATALLSLGPFPWGRESVVTLARDILRAHRDPRARGIRNVTAAAIINDSLAWDATQAKYGGPAGGTYRSLYAAISDRAVLSRSLANLTVVTVNSSDPVARTVGGNLTVLSRFLSDAQWQPATDWMASSRMREFREVERGSWARMLISFGAVDYRYERDGSGGRLEVRRRPVADSHRAYRALKLPYTVT